MKTVNTELSKSLREQHLQQRTRRCKESEVEADWVFREQPTTAGAEKENGTGRDGHKDKADEKTLWCPEHKM